LSFSIRSPRRSLQLGKITRIRFADQAAVAAGEIATPSVPPEWNRASGSLVRFQSPQSGDTGMPLQWVTAFTWKERLTMALAPSSFYYRGRIADEATWGEHELYVLDRIVARGGTAVDVGANRGVFAYAFSGIVDRVEAFEPNPDCAVFARRMLGARARVHAVALSDTNGRAEFVVPVSTEGEALHLGGNLKQSAGGHEEAMRFTVEVRTLDSYEFEEVRVVKVDVEGSELEVLEGGRETILRDRPALIVELLTGTHADPVAVTEHICHSFGYAARLATSDGEIVDALPTIRSLGSNTSWGSAIRNRNVLFLARP
jgi:FkbM family methyltransferase